MITEKDARAGAARDMGLLAELDFQIRDNHRLTSEIVRLKDENAKLRELVRDVALMNGSSTFWEYFDPYSFWQGWTRRASELGIEAES